MKKILLSLFVIMAFTGLATAQKTINDPNVQKRDVTGFHGIEVSHGIRLMLTPGATEEVAVSASKEEYRDKIITEVKNGILHIRYKADGQLLNSSKKEKKDLKAYVSYKQMNELDVNTGAEAALEGVLKSASLKMKVNTGGVVQGEVDVNDLNIDQNTGSVVTLTGHATKLDAEGSTGSIFKGAELKTQNCNASTSTGAGIFISVQKELSVKASTGGFVKYKGEGGVVEAKTNTGGSVRRI